MQNLFMDYHVHSNYSIDGDGKIRDYCRRAVEIGLQEIVFTEHFDYHPSDPGTGYFDYAGYSKEVKQCREEFGRYLTVKMGLELGESHLYKEKTTKFLASKDFDFLIGSVHWIGQQALHIDFCCSMKVDEAFKNYFYEVAELIKSGGFHVLGHLDVLKRYTPPWYPQFDAERYREEISTILEVAVEKGIGLEINTSGLRHGLKETLPSRTILSWYKKMGGEIITLGSDSHRVLDLASGLTEGYELAKSLGFQYVASYSEGKIHFHRLQ
ncbi:MAG: histidinol-phosphatase HisJ family protein [Bacillota bacterium]